MERRAAQALGLFGALLALLLSPLAIWPYPLSPITFAANVLYCLLAAALAGETAEGILALLWKPASLRQAAGVPQRRHAAVVMAVCDDASERHFSALSPLAAAGYDVFVLDDSAGPAARVPPFATPVRRPTRSGAKAGNLNHWLRLHGERYRFMILLDADSTMSVEAADALVLSAEDPCNTPVALFQAKIESALRHGSLVGELFAASARPRARIMERVHAPLGLLLSFGHNQLLRLSALREVGGFDESLTAEDTALSLHLAARDWKSALVDVWSHDEEPATVTAYVRRTVRWARQTVELFRYDWPDSPLRLKLLLCRHLLLHALPMLGTALLALSLWTGPRGMREGLAVLAASYELAGVMWLVFGFSLLSLALRVRLARSEGVTWRTLILSVVLSTAVLPLLLLPLAAAMLGALLGQRVQFVPTNSRDALRRDASRGRRWSHAVSFCGVLLMFGIAAMKRPGSLLLGMNWLWCALLFFSPVSLWVLTRRRER